MRLAQSEQSKPLLVEGDLRCSEDSDYMDHQLVSSRRRQIVLKVAALAHPAHVTTLCKRLGYACVPQLLRSIVWNEDAPKPKQFPTSYLNGLRGITAIKVFTFHYMMAYTDFSYYPWRMDERHDRILLAPIIRYFYSGFTSQIFFAIAGYLTSLRIFQLLDKNDIASQSKVLSNIAGSLFRRGFRLYLPVFIITFITMMYIYLGFYEDTRKYIMNRELFPGPWNETKPAQFDTFNSQFQYWSAEMFCLSDITKPGVVYPEHDQHLWSILAEMRASLFLTGCLVTVATCKRFVRITTLCIMTYMFFLWDQWETWIYILGAVVAQIDIILTEMKQDKMELSLPAAETEKLEEKHAQAEGLLFTTSLPTNSDSILDKGVDVFLRWIGYFIAFYLLAYPISGAEFYSPGYETLKLFIPDWMSRQDKMYPNIGAAILLLLLVRSDPKTSKWRRLLMSPIPQYLGTISFALYLIHGPILHLFGYMIPHRIWWASGVQGADVGDIAWVVPIIIGYTISLAVSLYVADVWSREVEGRCIRAVKKLESVCFK